jgi:hypothetical protein
MFVSRMSGWIQKLGCRCLIGSARCSALLHARARAIAIPSEQLEELELDKLQQYAEISGKPRVVARIAEAIQ